MQKSRYAAFSLITLIGIVILVAWITSYSTAHQFYRSRWHETGSDYAEKAHWLISNFGSVGVAWRHQQFPKEGNNFPASAREHKSLPASESAFSHVHALGILPWHWFDYHNESTMHGITPVTNGQLYVPYWFLLILSAFTAALVYPRTDD